MELRIGARKFGGIWHGYVEGRTIPDEDVRALTAGSRSQRSSASPKGSLKRRDSRASWRWCACRWNQASRR